MNPHIQTYPLFTLASGDEFYLQSYQFCGKQTGKKAYIQSNLHGSEIVGNAVIYQLIEFLSNLEDTELVGEILFVPVCNPLSVNQRSHFFASGRYNPYDGRDWNRIFWDYEKEQKNLQTFIKSQMNLPSSEIYNNYLGLILKSFQEKHYNPCGLTLREIYRYQLQSLCLDANYVMDIHSSTNQSIDYLYCFESREESASYFGLEYGILMREYDGDAFDEAFMKPWLALERQFAKSKLNLKFEVESWTLELGSGMIMNPESVTQGVWGIKNYLAYKGMLPNYPLSSVQEMRLINRKQIQPYYAPTGGMIQNALPLNHPVSKGDRLYQILSFNKQGKIPEIKNIYAIKEGFIFDHSSNQAVNQGEYVLSVCQL